MAKRMVVVTQRLPRHQYRGKTWEAAALFYADFAIPMRAAVPRKTRCSSSDGF